MLSERLSNRLYRYRFALLALCLLHMFWFHYRFLGFWSWDGFGHRGFPVVELLQHGTMGTWKFSYEWSVIGYTPFVELAHLPFLAVFGMKGFIIGFPLVVLPLCVAAVFLLVRELTGSERAGFFGAFAYLAQPMINQQPFSGYIDFAVSGILAYFFYALIRVRASDRPLGAYVRLVLATFLFTMSRAQGPYVIAMLFPILSYALFCERERFRIRIPVAMRHKLLLAAAAVAIGAAPAIAFQIYKYFEYGSPIAPMQLKVLGIELGKGVTHEQYFQLAGVGGLDLPSLGKAALDGWIWKHKWPLDAFYTSRNMAAGLLFLLAVLLFPVFWRRSTRVERWLLAGGLVVSYMTKDFAVPRWGYTTVLAIAIILGRSMGALAESRRGRPLFWFAFAVMCLHLLRPEFDYLQLKHNRYLTPRLNMTGAKWRRTRFDVPMYPDGNYRLYIINTPGNNFVLEMYGRDLTNEVLGTIPTGAVGPDCSGLAPYLALNPGALFVDDHNLGKDCKRECVAYEGYCLAYRFEPGQKAEVPAPRRAP